MSKRLFSFSYYMHKSGRAVWPHELRDATAFAELMAHFIPRGYDYGGPLMNYPLLEPPEEPIPVDVSFLKADDLLVLPTRPPMDDHHVEERQKLYPSHTTFEAIVFKALRAYFDVCSRTRVILSESMAALLEPPFTNRADILFGLYAGAWSRELREYKAFRSEPAEKNRTAAYLVRLDHLWEDGPSLLAVFGVGGVETLVWLYLLRRRYPELLETPGFVMAELEGMSLSGEEPFTLAFAEEWKVNLLIQHAFPENALVIPSR